jgi:hypothetical protein
MGKEWKNLRGGERRRRHKRKVAVWGGAVEIGCAGDLVNKKRGEKELYFFFEKLHWSPRSPRADDFADWLGPYLM